MSLQHLFPLLQDTFLGLLNHVVSIQNQTRDSIFQVLGHPPPPPFPTFEHPYRSIPTSPSSPRPSPSSTQKAPATHTSPSSPHITQEMLSASLEAATAQTASTVEPVLKAVADLVADIPSSSRAPEDSDDEVIVMDAPPPPAQHTAAVETAPAQTTAVEHAPAPTDAVELPSPQTEAVDTATENVAESDPLPASTTAAPLEPVSTTTDPGLD